MARTGRGAMTDVGSLYSPTVGMVFVFNLIVGTGALAMPGAFHNAGWLLSLILVIIIAFTSYITVTYVVESMACANAMLQYRRRITGETDDGSPPPSRSGNGSRSGSGSSNGSNSNLTTYSVNVTHSPSHERVPVTERSSLLQGPIADDYFKIRERVEMGQMVSLFFNKFGVVVFYICIIVYLYGDLAIYAAAVPKSLRDVICVYKPPHINCSLGWNDSMLNDTTQCFPGVSWMNRMTAYRLCVVIFSLALGPFTFFNVQKTTGLQIVTSLLRWLAFGSMIVLAIYELATKGVQSQPKVADFTQVPDLFGVCVYSFMCHHSLPSLVTPIRKKNRLGAILGLDYGLILVFYSLLSLTAVFAFTRIPDLYTLTFEPSVCPNPNNPAPPFFQYFLALFPVFTLSTNFPIIGITLRNNLKTLFLTEGREYHFLIDKVLFPLLVLLPPVAVAIGTNEIEFLVGITGSYAGAALQYFIPVALVFYGRRTIKQTFGVGAYHKAVSPFKHWAWLVVLSIWALACIVFVSVKHLTPAAK